MPDRRVLAVAAKTNPKAGLGLPRDYYFSATIYAQELEKVLARQWLIAGHVSAVRRAGDYFTRQVGPENLIILRDHSGRLRAYHNVCRHRGFRLIPDGQRGCSPGIVCPYHQWSYKLDGRLMGAPGSRNGEHFDFANFGLHEVACTDWHGFIYVHLGPDPTDPHQLLNQLGNPEQMRRANTGQLRLAATRTYDIAANWKSVMENEVECYHCEKGHPMLASVCNYRDLYADESNGGFFSLYKGMQTFSRTGKLVSKRLADDLPDGFGTGVMTGPVFCGLVVFADHAAALVATPLSINETRLICEWYVREDAVEGTDYVVEQLIEAFDVTNKEDAAFAARNYLGMSSMRHVPGPVHPLREALLQSSLEEYRGLMGSQE
jgi:phenylpropionate dioxygenase-like ring-hydroxylating dioxygenase large terminal subunit